jgi:hypothetical protein
MPSSPEVDLVFADLQDAYHDLEAAAHSPKQVCRAFSGFVELTQRLMSVMRKEFKARRGQEWKAFEFPDWNETTHLFKDLRNEEQHERLIYISIYETRHYKISNDDKRLFAFSGTRELSDQLMDNPPDGITYYPADPSTGQMSAVERQAVRVEYKFLLQARDETLRHRLQAIGSANVHELSKHCLATLNKYHQSYVAKLDA